MLHRTDFIVAIQPKPKRKFMPRLKVWKLRDPEKQAEFAECFKAKVQVPTVDGAGNSVEELWTMLKVKVTC